MGRVWKGISPPTVWTFTPKIKYKNASLKQIFEEIKRSHISLQRYNKDSNNNYVALWHKCFCNVLMIIGNIDVCEGAQRASFDFVYFHIYKNYTYFHIMLMHHVFLSVACGSPNVPSQRRKITLTPVLFQVRDIRHCSH